MLIAFFVLFFVAGPLLFRSLLRGRPTAARMRRLGLLMASAAATALVLRYALPLGAIDAFYLTTAIILFVWLAWIAALVLGTNALRRLDPSPRMRRWSGVIGMMATTVPWFGLAWAEMVGG